jgi:hypothetical protein
VGGGAPDDWTDPDWVASIVAWSCDRLADLGRSVVGPVEQPHVRPWSTALRIPTDRGVVWCKAARRATGHEGALLEAFATWDVREVLAPLAVDRARAWLLLPDGGTTLRQTRPDGHGDRDLAAWEAILAAYAGIQRAVEDHAHDLLALDVPDGRPEAMPATFDRLVDDDSWWRLVGPDDRAEADAARIRLRDMRGWVDAESAALGGSGIAATVQHDDLHGGNVFVGPAGIRIFDWGDAVVAHPFATLLGTLNSVARATSTDPEGPALGRLRDAYLEAWTDVLPRAALDDVFERALDLGRIGKAAAWARALDRLPPDRMDGRGDGPALWLVDLVERLDRRQGRST